ncbi:MAG: hypothetical protein EXR50_03295 [Dehalococcoidia bacterium]|nr:hypothetical protein [Dehalococcoidia bacterium]
MDKPRSKIPRFKNYEEEARFWDTHSVADFEEELEKVELRIERPLKHSFLVSLDAKSLDELIAVASSKDTDFVALAQIWIMDRLAHEREKGIRLSSTTERSDDVSHKRAEGK